MAARVKKGGHTNTPVVVRLISEILQNNKSAKIIDIACGTGVIGKAVSHSKPFGFSPF